MYCNNCGKHNPEGSKFCQHCGIGLQNSRNMNLEKAEDKNISVSEDEKNPKIDQIDVSVPPYPYVISNIKLIALSITTFGLYEIYWFYKQFKSFKAEDEWKITPWARAIFCPLTAYSLFDQISKSMKKVDSRMEIGAGGLAIVFFILNALGRAPEPYFWIGVFTFLPIIPVQNAINLYWEKKYNKKVVPSKFGVANWIWAIGGGIVVLLAVYGTLYPTY